MSSLREEIEDIVRNTRDFTSPKITNMILEEIEKRIDSEFINLRDKEIIKLDNAVGWNNALRTIKEMLK